VNLNIGCGPHYAEGWVNVDVDRNVRADLHIDPDEASIGHVPGIVELVDRVYLGHVIEHVRWEWVPRFLSNLYNLVAPGGEMCIVTPDCRRAFEMTGHFTWHQFLALTEDDEHHQEHATPTDVGPSLRHQWMAYEDRVLRVIGDSWLGAVSDIRAYDPEELPEPWPIVSRVPWQSAIVVAKHE
jgi:hypothetical protein